TIQRQLMLLLARQSTGDDNVVLGGGGKERFENEDEWEGLLESMLELWDLGVIGRVGRREVYEVFLAGVLGAGRFDLAKRIMLPERGLPPLPVDVSERLVAEAANELFDNADSGDIRRGLVGRARECLKILPPSQQIKTFLDLIDATHILSTKYHIPYDLRNKSSEILPIQIRLHPDRTSLIRHILILHPKAYKNVEELLDLAKKLVGPQFQIETELR
ncbi:hypothetical protein HK097_006870, partial [Rhizophlyctis rosea]